MTRSGPEPRGTTSGPSDELMAYEQRRRARSRRRMQLAMQSQPNRVAVEHDPAEDARMAEVIRLRREETADQDRIGLRWVPGVGRTTKA